MKFSPLTLHEAEVAVWHATRSGLPVLDPVTLEPIPALFGKAKSSLSLRETNEKQNIITPGDVRGEPGPHDEQFWEIAIQSPFGQIEINGETTRNEPNRNGEYIVVIKWVDEDSRKTIAFQFHYAILEQQGPSSSGQLMNDAVQFRSTHLEFFPGEIAAQINEKLHPLILGRLEWTMNGQTITCFSQDPHTGDWQEWKQNEFAEGERRIYFGPWEGVGHALILSYLDYARTNDYDSDFPNQTRVMPVKRSAFAIKESPTLSKGIMLMDQHQLQAAGCPEVLQLPEPYHDRTGATVTFRYLRRIYASIRDQTIAFPRLEENQIPRPGDLPSFYLRGPGDVSPETRNRGVTVTPSTAFVDGSASIAESSHFEPEISFEFIPTGDSSGGLIQYRGLALGGDGLLYTIPYSQDKIKVINPETSTVVANISVAHLPYSSTSGGAIQRWVDAATDTQGNILANPDQAHGHLLIDTSTFPATVDRVTTSSGTYVGYGMQLRGGAIGGNTLYSVRYAGSDVVRTVDLLSYEYRDNIPYTLDRTGEFYELRTNWASDGNDYGRFWGLVAGEEEFLFGIPFSYDKVMMINTLTNEISFIPDSLNGGFTIPASPEALPSGFLYKYNGGTYSKINKCIYCYGRKAKAILKINTVTKRATEIPLPPIIDDLIAEYYPYDSIAFSSFESPDGLIASVPWQIPYIFWIDPRTDQIGYRKIADELVNAVRSPNYYTYARTVGRDTFFSPGSADTIMKMTWHR